MKAVNIEILIFFIWSGLVFRLSPKELDIMVCSKVHTSVSSDPVQETDLLVIDMAIHDVFPLHM